MAAVDDMVAPLFQLLENILHKLYSSVLVGQGGLKRLLIDIRTVPFMGGFPVRLTSPIA
jgi:hypothetical protein